MEMRADENIYATIYPIPNPNPIPIPIPIPIPNIEVIPVIKNNIFTLEPSAPPVPWYYYKYRPEVLVKAYKVTGWNKMNCYWQFYYLESYYIRYLINDLD